MPKHYSEQEAADIIEAALHCYEEQEGDELVNSIRSFQSAMMLTENTGLVWRLPNGQEFTITLHERIR